MKREVTDEMIVESILEPSKTIAKGFETVKALTLEIECSMALLSAKMLRRLSCVIVRTWIV